MLSVGVSSAIIIALTMLPITSEIGTQPPVQLNPELWEAYRDRFINNGRVVDDHQGGISHSEGQGYGMLMAEAAGDRESFAQLWQWTNKVLKRDDGLFSWRYQHCSKMDASCITDPNNASDGEILIAWALLRAHHRWHDEDYYRHAQRIATSVARRLLVSYHNRLLLLPGSKGFSDGDKLTLNASYWVFPALESFSEEFDQPLWDEVIASGQWLLRQGRFGSYQLPADWIELENNTLRLSEKFPPRYSYDAVRIPLYQAWSNAGISKEELAPYQDFWSHSNPTPAWFDLKENKGSSFSWNTGMEAIAALAKYRANSQNGTLKLPHPGKDEGYYSWSLTLLCHIAATETAQ